MKNGRVNIGIPGQTPKKELMYSQSAPAESVSWLAFAQTRQDKSEISRGSRGNSAPLVPGGGEVERPKTSRHKQHPTPDEFTDYVIPSPERGFAGQYDERNVLSFERIINEEVCIFNLLHVLMSCLMSISFQVDDYGTELMRFPGAGCDISRYDDTAFSFWLFGAIMQS